MTPAAYLLVLPDDYAAELSQLHWAAGHDAVETAEGRTFALADEVAAFLDGFASRRPLMHFAHVLHFLYLLRVGRRSRHDFGPLARAWREANRPTRTAGAFAAELCSIVPALASPVDPDDVLRCLRLRVPLVGEAPSVVEDPPFSPDVFEAIIASALDDYSFAQLVECLRHGQPGPADAPERLASQVMRRPPSLGDVIDALRRHERLAGAVPLVDRLVGALALPPRRLADVRLPLGGYSDVGTRGQPEQILPAQFALDELEFLRRHAERELLYYQREEPHAPTCDRLLVLLDQGVRTWGRVRLALAGCLLALAEMARRRNLALTFAFGDGAPLDPLTRADVADLAGASDLSAHPGLALERTLEQTAGPCDVVLLTHPRNLDELDVQTAARRAAAGVRLFAVAVEASGEVTFSELRRGLPVRLGRFHLDLSIPPPAPPLPPATGEWRGPLEPVPFPFRFGPGGSHEPFRFAFDADGERLLMVLPHGLLTCMKRDGSASELLPRVLLDGRLMTHVAEVIGVAGGFVVWGIQTGRVVVAHYDFLSRQVRAYPFDVFRPPPDEIAFRYLRRPHALALCVGGDVSWVRLATGRRDEPFPDELRWQPDPGVSFDHLDATLDRMPEWMPFTPLRDGQPALLGRSLRRAECRADVMAALFQNPDRSKELWLFAQPEGRTLATIRVAERDAFALSEDGRYLAMQSGSCQLQVRETATGAVIGHSTVGRFHNNLVVHLGDQQLLLSIDRRAHLFAWGDGVLTHDEAYGEDTRRVSNLWRADQDEWPAFRAGLGQLPAFLDYDRSRFRLATWQNLIAVVTLFGEVFLFETTGELVCGFFVFRQQAAAWMPDGTCWGSEALLGRAVTPGASRTMGNALGEAWQRGERTEG